jgi:hypothetical protein
MEDQEAQFSERYMEISVGDEMHIIQHRNTSYDSPASQELVKKLTEDLGQLPVFFRLAAVLNILNSKGGNDELAGQDAGLVLAEKLCQQIQREWAGQQP